MKMAARLDGCRGETNKNILLGLSLLVKIENKKPVLMADHGKQYLTVIGTLKYF